LGRRQAWAWPGLPFVVPMVATRLTMLGVWRMLTADQRVERGGG
jgi:hypothetical protein